MNETVYYLWLNFIEDILTSKKCELLEHFGSAENVYKAEKSEYMVCDFLTDGNIKELEKKDLQRAEKELAAVQSLGIKLIKIGDSHYPPELLNIPDPPVILYAFGNTAMLKSRLMFCIVGSRKASDYGITSAAAVSTQLAECGMTIVSGCALGVDSAAHMGALRAGGKTVGVAACGLNVDYPSGNHPLREDLIKSGVMISEFPLNTPPLAYNFPKRNRILSGMCLGTAVIEAGRKSGALLTARHAYEQNRDVFALPGNITSRNSAGTNELIRDGAIPLLDAETILSEYMTRYPELFAAEENTEEDSDTYENGEHTVIAAAELFDADASSEEKKILSALLSEPLRIDEIAVKTGIDASRLGAILTMMQIKGKVRRLGENIYTRL